MANVHIAGGDRPIAFNFRALRLFKEKTGESLFGFIAKLQPGNDDSGEAAASLMFDEPEKLAYLVWALLNGPQGADVPFEDVETALDLKTLPAITAAIAQEIAAQSPASEGEPEGNEKAATETSTSPSSGASVAAA